MLPANFFFQRTLTSEVDVDSLPEVGVKDPQPSPGGK